MNSRSDIQLAEATIRAALENNPGSAMMALMERYAESSDKQAFVASLVANLVSVRVVYANGKSVGRSGVGS